MDPEEPTHALILFLMAASIFLWLDERPRDRPHWIWRLRT